MVVGFTTTYAITTKVVSSNPAHGEAYSIQYYVIKSANDLLQGFSTGITVFNQTDSHDIVEILLKVALNTITLTLDESCFLELRIIALVDKILVYV
jgi:hypothetical protein